MEETMERALGRIEGVVEGLDGKVDSIVSSIKNMERENSEMWRRVYEKIDTLSSSLIDLKNRMDAAETSIDNIGNIGELNGSAIVDLEKRVTKIEPISGSVVAYQRDLTEIRERLNNQRRDSQNNIKWMKWIAAGLLAIVGGDHLGSVGKFLKSLLP